MKKKLLKIIVLTFTTISCVFLHKKLKKNRVSTFENSEKKVKELNDLNFEEFISKNNFVIVDFWAPWCPPCRNLSPIIDEISKESKEFLVGKLNVDKDQKIAELYQIKSLPTIIIFKNSKEIGRIIGFLPKDKILEKIKNLEN
jgi:thioredoxin 1